MPALQLKLQDIVSGFKEAKASGDIERMSLMFNALHWAHKRRRRLVKKAHKKIFKLKKEERSEVRTK